jgi:hypothetical protein
MLYLLQALRVSQPHGGPGCGRYRSDGWELRRGPRLHAPSITEAQQPGAHAVIFPLIALFTGRSSKASNTGFKKIIFKQKALRGYLFES